MTDKDLNPVQYFLYHVIKNPGKISSTNARNIAIQFSSLKDFKNLDVDTYELFVNNEKQNLKQNAQEHLKNTQSKIEPDKDLIENWIKFTSRYMTDKIIKNIKDLTLDKIFINGVVQILSSKSSKSLKITDLALLNEQKT